MNKKKSLKKTRTGNKLEVKQAVAIYKAETRSFTPTRVVKQPISAMAEYTNSIINTCGKTFKKKKNGAVKVTTGTTPQKERPSDEQKREALNDQVKNIFKHIETHNVPLQNKLDSAFHSKRLEKVYRLTPTGSPLSSRSLLLSCRDSHRSQNSNNEIKLAKQELYNISANSKTEKISLEYVCSGHSNSVNSILLQNSSILTASSDYSIKKWKLLKTLPGPYIGKEYTSGQIFDNSEKLLQYSRPVFRIESNNSGVLAGLMDKSLKFIRNEEQVSSLKTQFLTKSFSRFGEDFLLANERGLSLLNTENFKISQNLEIKDLCFVSPQNENNCLIGDTRGAARLIDTRLNKVASHWNAHCGWITGMTCCNKGIFTCSEDGYLKLWDLRSCAAVGQWESKGTLGKVLVFKEKVITGGDALRIWTDGNFTGLPGRCKDFVCRDGNIVAARDQQVVVWNLQTNNGLNEYI